MTEVDWHPSARGDLPDAAGLACRTMRAWLHRSRRGSVLLARGEAAAAPGATATGTPRLVLAVGGRNRMRMPAGCRTEVRDLRPGDACMVHRTAWNEPTHAFAKEFCTIDLAPDRLRVYLRRTAGPGRDGEHARVLRDGPEDPALAGALAAAEALADPDLRRDAARLAVGIVVGLLARPAPAPAGMEARWQTIADWCLEHLADPIGRVQAARAAGIHPGHLSRLAQAAVGRGFAAWLASRRIARSKVLLAGGMPVAEAGRRCGYPRPSHFVQVFRRATGATPGAWRGSLKA